MKNYLALLLPFLFAALSCSNNRSTSDEENGQIKTDNSPETAALLDSINRIKIYIPPVFDKEYFDSAATKSFYELAKGSDGEMKLLINSKIVVKEIANIIEKYATDNADVVLLIDRTGSMVDDIDRVRAGVKQIIDALKLHTGVRFALSFYGDKNYDDISWFLFKDLGTNYIEAQRILDNISVTGGGDEPESIYDAFFEIDKMDFWMSGTKRMIILVGDAPPLEKPLSNYSLKDVMAKAKKDKTEMNFYPIIVTPYSDDDIIHPPSEYKDSTLISALYPAVTNSNLNLTLYTAQNYSIGVFSASGNEVFYQLYATGNTWQHDFSALPDGVYNLQIVNDDKLLDARRFLIRH